MGSVSAISSSITEEDAQTLRGLQHLAATTAPRVRTPASFPYIFLQPDFLYRRVIRLIRQFYVGAPNYLQPIALCANGWTSSDVSTYSGPSLFTCSANFSNCANSNFSLASSAITFINITGEPASTSLSLASTSTLATLFFTATVTVTATASSATATIRYETSTGLLATAIAIPLVLATILLLTVWVLVREYKRRRNTEQLLREWNSSELGANAGDTAGSIRKPLELQGNSARKELPAR